MTIYFGYALIDNFMYHLSINILQEMMYKKDDKIKIKLQDFILEGSFNKKSNFFSGKAYGLYPLDKTSEGVFYSVKVDENFIKLFREKNIYQILLRDIKKIKPKIYPQIDIKNKSYTDLSVMSFNVCSDFIWTGEKGLRDVKDIIRYFNPDIVLLQEIGSKNFFKLSRLLGTYYYEYKGGILSKYVIDRVYTREPFSPIFGVKIKISKNVYFRVYNCHLTDEGYGDVEESNEKQLSNLEYGLYSEVYSDKNDSDLPSILAGDFNTPSHIDSKKPFPVSKKLKIHGWIDTYREVNKKVLINKDFTWPNCDTIPKIIEYETGKYCKLVDQDRERIDYIYTKNGKDVSIFVQDSFIVKKWKDNFPSDHNAVISRLRIYN